MPLDIDAIQCGTYLDASAHDGLLAPLSGEDNKATLFSIGNDKAPRLNDYSYCFLKKSLGYRGKRLRVGSSGFFQFWKDLQAY